MKFCTTCGAELLDGAITCEKCGVPVSDTRSERPTVQQNVYVEKSNGAGTAGFIFALIGLILSGVPVVNWILWFLGILLSFIGLFKAPRGLAVAGFIISIIGIIAILVLASFFGAIFGSLF
jgi:hypothetical protein